MSGEAIKWQVNDDWVAIGWHWSAKRDQLAIKGRQSWTIMGNHGQ